MDYSKFREKIINWEKYPGCIKIPRSPIINKGYPGSFNLSFTEGPFMDRYGKYQDIDSDFIFSTIQAVIRPEDIFESLMKSPDRYLGVFEMADVYGSINLKEKIDTSEIHKKQLTSLISLFNSLGIRRNRIYFKYCAGGDIKEITENKYNFDFYVPEDIITKDILLELGIHENNIIPDKTRNSFLSLFLNKPTPWGYRIEIEIDVSSQQKKLLDVATIEYLVWTPIFKGRADSKNIVGLKDISHSITLSVVGLERLFMASEGLNDIREIDYLKYYYRSIADKNKHQGELIRALHFICSDVNYFGLKIGKHRGWIMNRMAREIDVDIDQLKTLLEINAKNQPWHSYLKDGIESTISFIKQYRTKAISK